MAQLLIVGAGEFAIEALEIAEAAGTFDPLGFVEGSARPRTGRRHGGLPVYWIDELPFAPGEGLLVAAVGHPIERRTLVQTLQASGHAFTSVIHPSALVSLRAVVQKGAIVGAGAVVSSGATLGPHALVNRGALIGHDVRVGAFATIGPGANVAGGATIGTCAYLGVGAVVSDHLSVGDESVVGAGAVVTRPVPANVVVAGVPARVVQTGVVSLPS